MKHYKITSCFDHNCIIAATSSVTLSKAVDKFRVLGLLPVKEGKSRNVFHISLGNFKKYKGVSRFNKNGVYIL